jgi:acetyl-CoA C-acetyltransferase
MIYVLEKPVYVLGAARTPIGGFNGSLSPFNAPELGGRAIAGALERAGVSPDIVEIVTMGCVVSSGLGEAPAKQAALKAGIPETIYSRTVESVCGSSVEALVSTIDVLLLGRAGVALAGGMESRTNAPYLLEPRFFRGGAHYAKGERLHLKKTGAYRFHYSENVEEQAGQASIVDATAYDGLFWPVARKFMREYAVAYAERNRMSLDEVNAHAARSHAKAREARDKGYFRAEIIPIGDVEHDDLHSPEALERMKKEAETDIACAFNTSTPADNGAAAVLSTKDFAKKSGAKPLARILGWSRVDGPAADFVDSPVAAVKCLLARIDGKDCRADEFEILEINEAFGIQLPLFAREFPRKTINPCGGAIAFGHPLGSAGVRLLTTLVHSMKRLDIRFGAMGICFGGGGSYAMAVELQQKG